MKFDLYGSLIMSKNVDDIKDEIGKFIEAANQDLLNRGAPEGKGANVTGWSVDGDKITLNITSGQYVRAHDALIRLKKGIGEELGKKHKVGARTASVDEYIITFTTEKDPVDDVTIPFVSEISFDANICTLTLKDLSEDFLQHNYIDRMIKLVNEKIENQYYEGKSEQWELMWESELREPIWTKDPTEEMINRDWLKMGPEKGKWFFRPRAAAVLNAMKEIAVDEILKPLGFQEIIESHHVSFDIWLKTGHIEGSPNELYYVCEPATRDIKAWERFRDLIKITRQVPTDELKDLISAPTAGICYAQCPVIYWSFTGKVIADESLPVLVYDRTANSNRYESGGRHGIERVDEFHRIEPTYIGTPDQLVELRDKMIERYKYVFNEILELEWRMAWVTPWYLEQAGQVDKEDKSVKIKGTIDFEAYLPYRGSREDSEWLEFQNLSILGDKFIKPFNIKAQKAELWSGCSGIGLERWTAAFLAQKGLEFEKWPKKFQEKIGDMPVGIKFM